MSSNQDFTIADVADSAGFLLHTGIENIDNLEGVPISQKIKVEEYINSGASGSVFKVRDVRSGVVYAAKVYQAGQADLELQALQSPRMSSHHPARKHIIRLHAVSTLAPKEKTEFDYLFPIRIGLISWCDGGDLVDEVVDRFNIHKQDIPESFLWHVLRSLLQAIAFLSDSQVRPDAVLSICSTPDRAPPVILSRDLKPDNVLLRWPTDDPLHEGYPDVILADFSCAVLLDSPTRRYRDEVGLPAWQPPEWPIHSNKSEVWGVGAVMHALAHRGLPPIAFTPPHRRKNGPSRPENDFNPLLNTRLSDFYKSWLPKDVRALPARYSRELNTIVMDLLTEDANQRPTAKEMCHLVEQIAPKRIQELWVDLPSWAAGKGKTVKEQSSMTNIDPAL